MPYDSIEYVGQEMHHALRRLFERKQCKDVQIHHRDDRVNGKTTLTYCISGLEVSATISKQPYDYHWQVSIGSIGSEDTETRADKDIRLKRSKQGKLSPVCLDKLASESLEHLREFYRSRNVK